MTAAEDAIATATRGMSADVAEQFYALPLEIQEAYRHYWIERQEKKASHRDALEAFAAGWRMRGQAPRRRSRKAA